MLQIPLELMIIVFNYVFAIRVTMMMVHQIFANYVILLVTNAADPSLIIALIANPHSLDQ